MENSGTQKGTYLAAAAMEGFEGHLVVSGPGVRRTIPNLR